MKTQKVHLDNRVFVLNAQINHIECSIKIISNFLYIENHSISQLCVSTSIQYQDTVQFSLKLHTQFTFEYTCYKAIQLQHILTIVLAVSISFRDAFNDKPLNIQEKLKTFTLHSICKAHIKREEILPFLIKNFG